MSHGPSTFGTMTTSSLSPISVTRVVMSSRTQGESSALTRVQSAVSPRSISWPTFTSPARAASLFSTAMASSRLPRTMSAFAAMSGSLPTIFSFEGSKKWIIRDGLTGISSTGSGAPTASGLRKSRGLRKVRLLPVVRLRRAAKSIAQRAARPVPCSAIGRGIGSHGAMKAARLIAIVGVLLLVAGVGQAGAAGAEHCASPKRSATRGPVKQLKAGYATSCATARKVAVAWNRACEPIEGGLCFVRAAGDKWSCRSSRYVKYHVGGDPQAPPQMQRTPDYFLKCALKETVKGRPSVGFRENGVIHDCQAPSGTKTQVLAVHAYFDASCAQAVAVAAAWGDNCTAGDAGSSCTVEARGERWSCRQPGSPDSSGSAALACSGERTGGGRTAVSFAAAGAAPPPPEASPGSEATARRGS